MSQKSLSLALKAVVLGLGILGAALTFFLLPLYGREIVEEFPEFSGAYLPWLLFVIVFSLPCFAALFFGWKIARNIGLDRSFTKETAEALKIIAFLAVFDAAFFFVANWVFAFFNVTHPAMLVLVTPFVTFVGVSAAVVFFALSHLIYKAALLREDADLTI